MLQQVGTKVRPLHVLLRGDTTFPPCLPHKPFDVDEGISEVFLGLISGCIPDPQGGGK